MSAFPLCKRCLWNGGDFSGNCRGLFHSGLWGRCDSCLSMQKVKKNRDDLKDLCRTALEIMNILQDQISLHGDTGAVKLKGLCEDFERYLSHIHLEFNSFCSGSWRMSSTGSRKCERNLKAFVLISRNLSSQVAFKIRSWSTRKIFKKYAHDSR